MQTLSSFTFLKLLFFLQINREIQSSEFNIYSPCECEQLLYKKECDIHVECSFSNNKCTSIPCNQLKTNSECLQNQKCGWDQGVCSKFESCSNIRINKPSDCNYHNHQCSYNNVANTCNTYDKVYPNTCSETSLEYCFYGKDGICYQSDGKCKKLNACEDVEYNDLGCKLAYKYCNPNTITKKCESIMGCRNAGWSSCQLAAKEMSSSNYFICQYGNDEECEDWDVSTSTLETCHSDSFGYYHWTGSSCVTCQSCGYLAILLMTNVILFS